MTNLSLTLAPIVLGSLGAVWGGEVAKFSARRSAEQPLLVATSEEWEVVGGVLERPSAMAPLWKLTGEDFGQEELGRLWEEMRAAVEGAVGSVSIESEKDVERMAPTFPADLVERVRGGEVVAEAQRRVEGMALSDDELVKKGGVVLEAGLDRGKLSGAGVIERGGEGEAEWVRRASPMTSRRRIVASVVLGAQLAVVPFLVHALDFSLAGSILAGAALVILCLVGTEVALVDHDTMYIDAKVFWPGAGVVWLLTVGSLLAAGSIGHLWAGSIALGGAVLFEGSNYLYTKLRGSAGMGAGDTHLLIVTSGIPAALTGSFALGWYSILAGLLAGILGWSVQRVAGRVTRETPFAFGPYMVMGWVLAWVGVLL